MPSQIEDTPTSLLRRFAAKSRALSRASTASQLRRNTLAGGLSSIAGVLISAISYPVYLHFLGYEQYGLWLATAIVLNFAQFGNLGLAPAVATKVAEDLARRDFAAIRTTVSTALVALTAVGVLAVGGVLVFGGHILGAMRLSPALAQQASGLLPFVALLSLYAVQIDTLNSVLVGLGRLDLSVTTQIASRALSLAVSTSMLATGFGVMSLPLGSLAGYAFLHLASLTLARRITGLGCFALGAFNFSRLRALATFGTGVLASSMMNLLIVPLNKFVLTRYAGPGFVPVYELAVTLSMQLRAVFESSLRGLMPEVSRLAAGGTVDAWHRICTVNRRALKLIVLVALPVFAGMCLVIDPILHLWLRARFRPELVPACRILMAGAFFSLLGVPGYYTLIGLSRLRHVFSGQAVQAITNGALIAFAAFFAHNVSGVSTAIATAVGIATGGIYLIATVSVSLRPAVRRASNGLGLAPLAGTSSN